MKKPMKRCCKKQEILGSIHVLEISWWHKQRIRTFQYIKGLYLDCDLDTIVIYVEQVGAACHTGSYSASLMK